MPTLLSTPFPFSYFFIVCGSILPPLIEFCVLARLSAYLKRRWFINLSIEEPSICKGAIFLMCKGAISYKVSYFYLGYLRFELRFILYKSNIVPLYGFASSIIAILSIWKRQWCIIRFIRLHCEKCACMVSSKICTWNVIGRCWYKYCNSLFAQVYELFKN